MNDVPQNTLNYQRFQRFTIVSTSQKQLKSIRKCKVVTVENLPRKKLLIYYEVLLVFFYIFSELFIHFDLLSLTNDLKYIIPKWREPAPHTTGCD